MKVFLGTIAGVSLLLCGGCSMDQIDSALGGMNAVGAAMFDRDEYHSGTGNTRDQAFQNLLNNAWNSGLNFSGTEVDPSRIACSRYATYWQCEGVVTGSR